MVRFRMDLWMSSLSASTPAPSNVSRLFEDYTSHPYSGASFAHIQTGLLPGHGDAGLANSIMQATQPPGLAPGSGRSGWYPSGTASGELEPSLARLPGLYLVTGRVGTWPAFTLSSAEWDDPPILYWTPPSPEMHMRGNMETEHLFTSVVTRGNNCRKQVELPGLLPNKFWLDTRGSAGNPRACLERGRHFALRNDNIFSQALRRFINACLIWGKRKTGCSIRGRFIRRELAMFWNKKQLLHQGTYGIIIAFSKPGCRAARERGKALRNSSTFTSGRAETRGL